MDSTGKTLEEKIANIKYTLKELGESLEFEDKYNKFSSTQLLPSLNTLPSPTIIPSAVPVNPKIDIELLYTYEKERNRMLEARILHKDELISEMTFLQNELYSNIEELQNKVSFLQSDLNYSQNQNLSIAQELENFSDVLKSKDSEISRLASEKDKYFSYLLEKDEESKLLNEELMNQEPDRKLVAALEKRNQELLVEINNLQHHLECINTSQFQVLALHEKVKSYEDELARSHYKHEEEMERMKGKIRELEKIADEHKIKADEYKIKAGECRIKADASGVEACKFKSYYEDVLALVGGNNLDHQLVIQTIREKIEEDEKPKNLKLLGTTKDELIDHADEIVHKVKFGQDRSRMEHKLYEKLADLMCQCSPKGKFDGLPTCQQVWKWITRILEDYMSIKKDLKL